MAFAEFEKISINPKPIQKQTSNNPFEDEFKMNKVQESTNNVKSNTINPGLFGSNQQTQLSTQQYPQSNVINNGIKTPQIFVENKNGNNNNIHAINNSNNNPYNNAIINNNNSTSNKNPTQNSNKNENFNLPNGSKVEKFIDNTTDKAFDALWENEKFQKGLKDGAKNLAYNAVASRVPIKGEPGVKHPLGSIAEKMTEKVLENDKVQKSLKDAAKNATKDAIKKEVGQKPVEKKKGLFSFI